MNLIPEVPKIGWSNTLLKNYDCFTTEDFEGDAIRFDLPSYPYNAEYVPPLTYETLMIPNIANEVLRSRDHGSSTDPPGHSTDRQID